MKKMKRKLDNDKRKQEQKQRELDEQKKDFR